MSIHNSTKEISFDDINKKLLQVDAIIQLLSANCRSDVQLTNQYIANALWAASDLISDVQEQLKSNREVVWE